MDPSRNAARRSEIGFPGVVQVFRLRRDSKAHSHRWIETKFTGSAASCSARTPTTPTSAPSPTPRLREGFSEAPSGALRICWWMGVIPLPGDRRGPELPQPGRLGYRRSLAYRHRDRRAEHHRADPRQSGRGAVPLRPGAQCTSNAFTQAGVRRSTSAVGGSADNATAESFNAAARHETRQDHTGVHRRPQGPARPIPLAAPRQHRPPALAGRTDPDQPREELSTNASYAGANRMNPTVVVPDNGGFPLTSYKVEHATTLHRPEATTSQDVLASVFHE